MKKQKNSAQNRAKVQSSNKSRSPLRRLLEGYLGAVSDKTWQRIRRQYLDIANEFLYDEHELAVRGYGLKRLLRPSDPIDREEAEVFGLIASRFEFVFEGVATGKDLRQLCQDCFQRVPSTRWFNDQGIHIGGVCSREQGLKVLAAITNRRRFQATKPAHEIPRVKRLPERVTDVFEQFAA